MRQIPVFALQNQSFFGCEENLFVAKKVRIDYNKRNIEKNEIFGE